MDFVEDIKLPVVGKYVSVVSELMLQQPVRMERWCVGLGLTVSHSKIAIMAYNRKAKLGELQPQTILVVWFQSTTGSSI